MRKHVLSIDVSHRSGVAVVVVKGEIDMESAPLLTVALEQQPSDKDAYIDMAEVRFIDSSGIAVLINQFARMRQHNCELHIQNPSRVVRRLLEIAGLSEHFVDFETAEVRSDHE
jgi:anti-anti-sigma factor